MTTLELLSKYLGSPIIADRNRALECLIKEAMKNENAIRQLELNLKSNNFDIVWFSLKLLKAISLRDTNKIKTIKNPLLHLGENTQHFGIAKLCKDILENLNNIDYSNKKSFNKLIPKFVDLTDNSYFFVNCDHSLKYLFGSEEYSSELSRICRAFRYDGKKATKQLFTFMKSIGYKKGKLYWKEVPSHWRNYYGRERYEIRVSYFARHGLQMLLQWCVKNLVITREAWEELLVCERDFDPSIPTLLFDEKPCLIKFDDLNMKLVAWLNKKITTKETYKLLDPKAKWIPLYESTYFKSEDKSYDRNVTTCFIKKPIGKLKQKEEMSSVNYECRRCYINEVPIKAESNNWLFERSDNTDSNIDSKLIPSYGIVTESFNDFVILFPTPEIVERFKLKQKKNTLEYYKGKELVIYCINWRSGYKRNIGRSGEDRFELVNYGQLLMIKTKFLKKYLEEKNFKLLAVGNIWKWKLENSGKDYGNRDDNSKYDWLPVKIIKM